MPADPVLQLPDQLLVRYYRDGDLKAVRTVQVEGGKVAVTLEVDGTNRTDQWEDLGGGLGFVPAAKGV